MYSLNDKNVRSGNSTSWLTEIRQNKGVRFALANLDEEKKEAVQLHEFVRCRDYFSDVLYCDENQCNMSVYGFKYDGTKNKLDKSSTNIILEMPSDDTSIPFNFPKLNEIESKWNINPSEIFKLKEQREKTIYLVKADPIFLNRTVLLSFYTLLLRMMAYPIPSFKVDLKEHLAGQDQSLYSGFSTSKKTAHEVFQSFLKNPFLIMEMEVPSSYSKVSGWAKKEPYDKEEIIHNYSGVATYFLLGKNPKYLGEGYYENNEYFSLAKAYL